MKRYSAAEARQHFADVLDSAEGGESVAIERRGVRFLLVREPKRSPAARRVPCIEVIDAAVEAGQWTWAEEDGSVEFAALPRSKQRR